MNWFTCAGSHVIFVQPLLEPVHCKPVRNLRQIYLQIHVSTVYGQASALVRVLEAYFLVPNVDVAGAFLAALDNNVVAAER